MKVIKREGNLEEYNVSKIRTAIKKAFKEEGEPIEKEPLNKIIARIESKIKDEMRVEEIQDIVEDSLLEEGFYHVAKKYILYRQERKLLRKDREEFLNLFLGKDKSHYIELNSLLKEIQKEFPEKAYSITFLLSKYSTFKNDELSYIEKLKLLSKCTVELTTAEASKWEMIAARFLYLSFNLGIMEEEKNRSIKSFYEKVKLLVNLNLYGDYLIKKYSKEELELASSFIEESRNNLFNYSGLDLLIKRYTVHTHENVNIENIQEMYLSIALHLAINEKDNRMELVKQFYDVLSSLKLTMATPTLSNARKPFHQLSSCFIDTIPDSLDGIYRSIDNFAKVSKYGGGMGLYLGKVRAVGSSIRGFKGVAGGIIRWLRVINDTAVAVDQLGVRQGACAVYLDCWHKDLPEFLQIRTNNGDDRMKAHDIFPGVCYPDLFWKQVKENLNSTWYLMCPHEILSVKGYSLEDFYGASWEEKYLDCVNDPRIEKRPIIIKDLIRLILKSQIETGTPFTFNRDIVNKYNPNKHKGMIYCSNLCTEIAQNMSEISFEAQQVKEVNGEKVIVTKTKPGDFVVCNLASLSLGRIDVTNKKELEYIVSTAVKLLDNVIDLNFYPLPYAEITNKTYRSIGLGVSGYHHILAKNKINWETDKHLEFVDKLFEDINYFALQASNEIAKSKGTYKYFEGSDYQNGNYFRIRNYDSSRWTKLRRKIKEFGLRNAYILAIAPTSSTSIIAGTTPGIDPIMKMYFLEEKKGMMLPRVAPDLSIETRWYYKSAYLIDQNWSIKANGVRTRHIDQAASMNLYITNDYTMKQILNLYISAWENEVKTIYYVRSKSLEVEECESCAS